MAVTPEKKAQIEREAQAICRRLLALRDQLKPELSGNDWTKAAAVSTSFFTNMQGSDKKSASEPGVIKLRDVLSVLDVSLSEFFLHESRGRVVRAPTRQALEQAFADALPDLPRNAGARASYLASTVQRLLGLPEDRPATPGKPGDHEVVAP